MAALVVLCCVVPLRRAHGYVLLNLKWPQSGPGQPVTLTYSYNNLLDGGLKGPDGVSLPTSLIRSSVQEALGLWASVAPLNFVEVPDQGGPVAMADYPNGQFGQIRFSHIYINGPDVPGQPPRAKALTFYPTGSGNLAGDIFLDDSDPWQQVGTLPTPDVLGAAIHELGHALGLDHSNDPNANMYWIFRRYNGPGTGAALAPDDIAGIQAIYGAGSGLVRPLLVPEPASAVLLTIGIIGCCMAQRNCRSQPNSRIRLFQPAASSPSRRSVKHFALPPALTNSSSAVSRGSNPRSKRFVKLRAA